MSPFLIRPGETVVGIGVDFAGYLATGETIADVTVTASAGLTASDPQYSGTVATATATVAADQADTEVTITFRVTGTLGSVRYGARSIVIRNFRPAP